VVAKHCDHQGCEKARTASETASEYEYRCAEYEYEYEYEHEHELKSTAAMR